MKKLNIKKLSAVVVGAALLGSALAPIATSKVLSKSDVISDTTGQPLVSIVVGSSAAASDAVWAGNIAARVAQLATVEEEVTIEAEDSTTPTVPEDVTVDITVGGTTSYSSESSKTDESTRLDSSVGTAAEFMVEWGKSQLPFLTDETKNFIFGGTSYTQTIREKIGIEGDVRFDYGHSEVKDLVMLLDSTGDLNYMVTFTKGLPYDNESGSGWGTFTDGSNDSIQLPFFGKNYTLFSATGPTTGDSTVVPEIKLVDDAGKVTYYSGESITGLAGKGAYAGQTLSVTTDGITETSTGATFQGRFSLYDGEGNLLDTQTISSGAFLEDQFLVDGVYILDTSLYVETVAREPETNKGYATITKGAGLVTLRDGKAYPYSSTDSVTSDDYWQVDLVPCTTAGETCPTSPDVNTITKIIIYSNVKEWDKEGPIWAGDDALTSAGTAGSNEAMFLASEKTTALGYNFVRLKFDGWKNDQDLTTIKIGELGLTGSSSAGIQWTNTSDFVHKYPFYFELNNSSTGSATFMIDSQTFYYKVNEGNNPSNNYDVNFILGTDNNVLNGQTMGISQTLFVGDGNNTIRLGADTNDTSHAIFFSGNAADVNTFSVDVNQNTYLCSAGTQAVSDLYGPSAINCSADGNFQISKVQFTSATDSDYIGTSNRNNTWYYDDANGVFQAGSVIQLTGSGMNDNTVNYAFYVNESQGRFYLLLDAQNFTTQYDKVLRFLGTDLDEDLYTVDDANYYRPDDSVLGNTTDQTYYIASFSLDDDENTTSPDLNVFVDASNGGKILQLPNTQLSSYGAVADYNSDAGASARQKWNMRYDLTNSNSYFDKAYTDFGSKFDISDDKTFIATIPRDKMYLRFSVLGAQTTTTTSGGETVSVTSGGTVTTAAGQTISIGTVNVTPGSTGSVTTTNTVVVRAGDLVMTDTEAFGSAGNHWIVGGHIVNVLADGITNDRLTAPGDVMFEMTATGDLVIAGYTAADTGTAARQLIAELEAMLG